MAEKSELRSRKSWGLPTRRPLLILAAVVLAKWQNQARPRGSKGVRKGKRQESAGARTVGKETRPTETARESRTQRRVFSS